MPDKGDIATDLQSEPQVLCKVRGQVVILDRDVARFFDKSVKAVNQNRARNQMRFADGYAFELTDEEWRYLKSQTVTASGHGGNHGGNRKPPWAYTEQGFLMLAMTFRGEKADRIARVIADSFVTQRRGEAQIEPVLIGPEAEKRRADLRGKLYDMIDAIAAMKVPGGSSVLDEAQDSTSRALARLRAWLDKPGIENTKLESEIALIAAQTQKAYAEVQKMDAETHNIWADTMLKRLEAVAQLREMAVQLDRDDLHRALEGQFDPDAAIDIPNGGLRAIQDKP